jgi:hypothetical protein
MALPTMSETLRRVQTLVLAGDVRVSDHGFAELAKDAILIEDIVAKVMTAVVVEDYPERFRGRSVLALQRDAAGRPVHVVWALPSEERLHCKERGMLPTIQNATTGFSLEPKLTAIVDLS